MFFIVAEVKPLKMRMAYFSMPLLFIEAILVYAKTLCNNAFSQLNHSHLNTRGIHGR